jgi:hypothetical protein
MSQIPRILKRFAASSVPIKGIMSSFKIDELGQFFKLFCSLAYSAEWNFC